MDYPEPQCGICKNKIWEKGKRICRAFPKGIPDPIYHSEVKHDKPYPGDNGIQFEPEQ